MAINTATPDDTHSHIFGAGADTFSWWRRMKTHGVDKNYHAADDWSVEVTIEDPNDDKKTITKTVNHTEILKAARAILADKGPERKWGGTEKLGASKAVVQECKHLIFDAEEVDFDAPAADEFLQVIVLGEVTYA